MNKEKQELARKIYLYLAALFITSLVVSNLIFQKFFYWYPFEMTIGGIKLFELVDKGELIWFLLEFLLLNALNDDFDRLTEDVFETSDCGDMTSFVFKPEYTFLSDVRLSFGDDWFFVFKLDLID